MEQSELRAGALELENESLSAHLDSMVDKLCFCTRVEVTSQVVGSDLSNWRKTDIIPSHWGQRGCYPGGKLRVF